MRPWIKVLLPILILSACYIAATQIIRNKPEPRSRPNFELVQAVEATKPARSDYQVVIRTQGAVSPTRESAVVPEVTGIIRKVSPNFVIGGNFREGELLIEIDRRDYEIALAQMQASYAQASAQLEEELARSRQARQDWESLGRQGQPSNLTARVPQVAAAKANLAAAKAKIEQAELDLERTRIRAPYDGRVLQKNIDEGEFVSRGAPLGRIYSLASVEVRLPISSRQLTHLDIPSLDSIGTTGQSAVSFSATIGGREQRWQGKLVRSEGVDATSQQLTVVAQIDDPFVEDSERQPLQIGQFVNAEIEGKLLENVFVIPRSAIRENSEVVVIDQENQLQKREVDIAWSDDKYAAVVDGLTDGEVLTLTALGAVTNGTTVRATIDGEKPPSGQHGGTSINAKSETGRGDNSGTQSERMKNLKALVDSGSEIPPDVKSRLQRRLSAGEKLPPWLVEAIK